MERFVPGLFDRLLGDRQPRARTAPEQLREAVARDLEDLFNTRVALPAAALDAFPECAKSVFNYGVADFAGLCLGSSEDQATVCASLRLAVERFEPRLHNVQVQAVAQSGAVNRIDFSITGVLCGQAASFDAMLQPSSLRYSIQRNARGDHA
jgi:type VI secretion system protein ImpF